MRLIRAFATAVALSVVLVESVTGAFAQTSRVCLQLEARLVQIERGGAAIGNVDRFRSYDGPIAQQRDEIDRAMAQARAYNCVGFVLFQRQDERCGRLMSTIDRMRANLSRLEAARGRDSDPFSLARERNEILRSMQINRCGPQYVYTDNDGQPGSGGLLATLFGSPATRTWGEDSFIDGSGLGTYRTLCVRTCDGFYFPISFSTIPGKFDQDAATCQQMCPGTEVTLFTHRNPGEDVAEAVSLAGEPYAALPNAFRYRKEFDRSCTCRSATQTAALTNPQFSDFGLSEVGASEDDPWGTLRGSSDAGGIIPPEALAVSIPVPGPRPAFGEDPETVANRAGHLDPVAVPAKPDGTELAGVTADGRKIRIVGPSYYYAQ